MQTSTGACSKPSKLTWTLSFLGAEAVVEHAQVPQRCEGAQRPEVLAGQHGRFPLVPVDVKAGAGVWQLRKAFQGRWCNHSQLQHDRGKYPGSYLRLESEMQEDAAKQKIL